MQCFAKLVWWVLDFASYYAHFFFCFRIIDSQSERVLLGRDLERRWSKQPLHEKRSSHVVVLLDQKTLGERWGLNNKNYYFHYCYYIFFCYICLQSCTLSTFAVCLRMPHYYVELCYYYGDVYYSGSRRIILLLFLDQNKRESEGFVDSWRLWVLQQVWICPELPFIIIQQQRTCPFKEKKTQKEKNCRHQTDT